MTVAGSGSAKTGTPVNVTMMGSQSSDGSSKVGAGISANINNTTLKAGVVIGVNQNTGFMEFNMGGEQKAGNTKLTNTTFIRFGQSK